LASQPSTGTGKKQGTAPRTATNQTAGPLYVRFRAYYLDIQRASKSLAACHLDGHCCCQTHAFCLSWLNQQDHWDIYLHNHQGFRSDKKSAWHIEPI